VSCKGKPVGIFILNEVFIRFSFVVTTRMTQLYRSLRETNFEDHQYRSLNGCCWWRVVPSRCWLLLRVTYTDAASWTSPQRGLCTKPTATRFTSIVPYTPADRDGCTASVFLRANVTGLRRRRVFDAAASQRSCAR
jgi:hypothetical protein